MRGTGFIFAGRAGIGEAHRPRYFMNIFLGIALQLGASFLFMLMGALVRYLGDRVPIGEQIFARSFLALIPLLIMLTWRREIKSALRMNSPVRHFTRAFTGIGAMVLMFLGLQRLPLADSTAISFVAPLFNVALAAIFLGEAVRFWRWSAVLVGFAGVLVMLSPHLGTTAMTSSAAVGALMTLVGAFLVAAAMTQVRSMTSTETTASLVFSFQLIAAFVGLLMFPWTWIWPAPADALALLGIGVFGGIAQILLTDSYRHAPASVVAPFSYTAMIWATLLGYFMFNELPDAIVLVGAAIVVGAGLFVIFRERALGINRQKEKEAATPPAGPPVE
jgi:drug/metabolite transporter (DMT)-like permease